MRGDGREPDARRSRCRGCPPWHTPPRYGRHAGTGCAPAGNMCARSVVEPADRNTRTRSPTSRRFDLHRPQSFLVFADGWLGRSPSGLCDTMKNQHRTKDRAPTLRGRASFARRAGTGRPKVRKTCMMPSTYSPTSFVIPMYSTPGEALLMTTRIARCARRQQRPDERRALAGTGGTTTTAGTVQADQRERRVHVLVALVVVAVGVGHHVVVPHQARLADDHAEPEPAPGLVPPRAQAQTAGFAVCCRPVPDQYPANPSAQPDAIVRVRDVPRQRRRSTPARRRPSWHRRGRWDAPRSSPAGP